MNAENVITALGGIPKAAKACAISESAVHKWKVNGVPSKHWSVIVEKTGIAFETLARMNGTARKGRAA